MDNNINANVNDARQAMADKLNGLNLNEAEAPAVAEEPVTEAPPVQPQQQSQPQQPQINPMQLIQAVGAIKQENMQLKQQLQQQQQLSQEAQKANEATVMQTLTAPIFPQYEYDGAGDEQRKAIVGKYNQEMAQYMNGIAEQRIKPMEAYYQQQTRQAEENNIINNIIRSNQLPDFQEKLPEIRQMIEASPALQKLPLESRYQGAYMMLTGHQSMKPKTPEDILAEVESNPEVMKLIEAKKIANAQQNSEIPAHVTSGGIANVAAAMPEQPPASLGDVKNNIMKTRFSNGTYIGRQIL